MVWFFCADHRDPIEKFLDTHVGPAGLRMKGEKQAPEYFNVVPAKGTDSSLVGLSIKGPLQGVIYGTDVKIDAKMQQVIAMDDTTKSTKPVEEVDYSLNTVWSLETQPDGKSLIYTASITKEKPDEDGFVLTTRTLWYLATSDDPENLKLELREMPGKEVKAERDAVMKHALWTIDIIGKPTVDRPDKKDEKGNIIEAGNILSAIANISQDGLQLGRWIDPKTGKPRDEFTVCHPDNGIMGESIFYARWEMSMAPIGPSEFTYAHPTWTLTVDDTVS